MPDLRDVQQAPGHRGLTPQHLDGSPSETAVRIAVPAGAAVRIAVDLYGTGDPTPIVAGAISAVSADDGLRVVLAGRPDFVPTDALPADIAARIDRVPAVPLNLDPDQAVRAIRGRRDASVRVAARLVRDGEAHGVVLPGNPEVALAAATFALRKAAGATRPFVACDLAPLLPAGPPCFLLDTSGRQDPDPAAHVQSALLGSGLARSRGTARPVVGCLATTPADPAGRRTAQVLGDYAAAGLFVLGEPVTVGGLVGGRIRPDVVVTDGFSGNVLREALSAARAGATASGVPGQSNDGANGLVVGLEGVVVLGEVVTADACARAIALATESCRDGAAQACAAALGDLVAWRRLSAGLNPVVP